MCIYMAPGSVSVITLVYLSMGSPDGDSLALWNTEKVFLQLWKMLLFFVCLFVCRCFCFHSKSEDSIFIFFFSSRSRYDLQSFNLCYHFVGKYFQVQGLLFQNKSVVLLILAHVKDTHVDMIVTNVCLYVQRFIVIDQSRADGLQLQILQAIKGN